jgi:dihydrofolate reductase
MSIVASAGLNWELGFKNRLLFRAKADMSRFVRLTTGNAVVMGRATFESLPGGKPLKNRVNIVLTRNTGFNPGGVTPVHSAEELLEAVKAFPNSGIYVIGGEQIYLELLKYCETAYITRFLKTATADRFLPDFDSLPDWSLYDSSEVFEQDGLRFRFDTYRRVF